MDIAELKTLWQTYDKKLEKSLALNLHLLQSIGNQKVTASFQSLVRLKLFAVFLGLAWNIFLGFLLYHYHTEPFFVISVSAIMLFTMIAMAGYIYQVTLINSIRLSDPVLETQRKLAVLQSSIIRLTRILFLQTPFYTTFFITTDLLRNGTAFTWIILSVIVMVFTGLSIWLYRNISFRNMNRNWVKTLVQNEGGKSIARATQYITEIEAFKKDVV
jgi:hypothetical protein